MTVEALLYFVIVLIGIGLVCDLVVLRVAFQMRAQARKDRAAAARYLDMAAEHGKTTDNKIARLDASSKSGVLPPSIVPPEARNGGKRGCSPAVLVPLTGLLVLVGWSHNRAEAAQEMRTENQVNALAWWAAERADSPLCGS